MDNSLIFGRYTTAVYMFASVMCGHILCIPVCFCWQGKIFAAVHCSQGFTGSQYLQDLPAGVKPLFQQPHIAPASHSAPTSCGSATLRYFPSTNPPSPPHSCPFQEVKIKGQTFFSGQATDFLRLLVSPVATKAFPEQSHYCSSTGMGNTQTEHGSLQDNLSVWGTGNTNAHLCHL